MNASAQTMAADGLLPARTREARIGAGVTVLAIAAMAVDHLMGSDPGLEDPPMFAIAVGLTTVLAAFVFGRVVPWARSEPERAARTALVMSIVAVVPGVGTLWLGLPFVLAGGGIALGLAARGRGPERRALAALAIGGLVLTAATAAYLVQAVDKL